MPTPLPPAYLASLTALRSAETSGNLSRVARWSDAILTLRAIYAARVK